MTTLRWDIGTAYDFILSLFVLHNPADFGLRPTWTAGVRQRLSTVSREFLERFLTFAPAPLDWIISLPTPKDVSTALHTLSNLSSIDRLAALTITPEMSAQTRQMLFDIATHSAWSIAEQDFLHAHYFCRGAPLKMAGLTALLQMWSNAEESSALLLSTLYEYQLDFFAEEEIRIRPALEQGLARAQEMANRLSVDTLIETLSHGVRLETLGTLNELVLAPSFWTSPLVFVNTPRDGKALMVFGVRSEIESIAPGAQAADWLVNALKSLADPTRLHILRYLSDAPLTPSELARRLRLRPPTVVHHLQALRLTGLVQVLVGAENERRYAARLETLNDIYSTLKSFLSQRET